MRMHRPESPITRVMMLIAIHILRIVERILPMWALHLLVWPGAAILSAWELPHLKRLPPSLWPTRSRRSEYLLLWRKRVAVNLTKLVVVWPDRFATPRWRARCDELSLKPLRRLTTAEQPVVMVLLHFGPLAVLKYWLRSQGFVVAGVVLRRLASRPAHRRYLDRLNDAASGMEGIPQLFDLSQLKRAANFIRPQQMLMMTIEGGHGHELMVERPDYTFRMATGAIRLAARLNGIVVPCCAVVDGAFRMRLHVGRPVAADGDLRAIAIHLMSEFEPMLLRHPEHCEPEMINALGVEGSTIRHTQPTRRVSSAL